MKKILIIFTFFCCVSVSYGQVDSILRAQDKLIDSELVLNNQLDSLQVLLNASRDKYSSTNSQEVANEIIKLENEIYDIKSSLSKIGFQLSQNEAKLERNGYQGGGTKSKSNVSSLLYNDFFNNNVSSRELSIIKKTIDVELSTLYSQVNQTYYNLVELKSLYDNAQTQEEVNALMREAETIKEKISSIDNQLGLLWGDIYQHKMDNYIVLLDKIGSVGRDKLELIDQLGREVVQNETSFGNSVAPNSALLGYQQKLVNGYELALAQELKLTKAVDSLTKVQAKIAIGDKFEDIQFPYKSLIVYGHITIGNTYTYSSLDDVPEIKLPTKGLYYAVQVAYVTGKASSLSIFKGALPLQQEVIGSKTKYILGGFRSYEEAVNAVKDCYKFGFKYPIVVAWLDGKAVSVQAAQAYQKENPVEQLADGYNVLIATSNPQIATRLKAIVDIHAKGKTISRVANGNEFIYTVSSFNIPEEAQVFAQIIKTEFSDVNVDVKGVE